MIYCQKLIIYCQKLMVLDPKPRYFDDILHGNDRATWLFALDLLYAPFIFNCLALDRTEVRLFYNKLKDNCVLKMAISY